MSSPTTGELKVKMDGMCKSIDEIKEDINLGFADLKKDLRENYVRNETFKLTLEPIVEFKKTVTGVGYGVSGVVLLGILVLLLKQIIPGFSAN
jgi:hypothetical protein